MIWGAGLRAVFIPTQDALLSYGANLGAFSVNGEYWRLFTSMFVHAGILHLALNMYALWTFGPTVCAIFGSRRFLVIYFISGLSGALASTVWNPAQISAGASGALVGIAGAMLAFLVRARKNKAEAQKFMHPFIFFAVICASLLYGFFNPDIDNASHVGGLLGGFLCGLVLYPSQEKPSRLRQLTKLSAISAVLLLAFAACVHAARSDKRADTYRIASSAMKHLRANEFEQAYADYDKLLKSELNSSYFVGRSAALVGMKKFNQALEDANRAIAISPKDQNAHLARARALHDLGNDDEAIKDLTKVIAANPKQASAYNSRAWSEIAMGCYDPAVDDATEALKINPEMSEALDTRGLALYCRREFDKALEDYKKGIELKPEDGACHFHRAMVYERQGQSSEAEFDRIKAKTLGYSPESWELKLLNTSSN